MDRNGEVKGKPVLLIDQKLPPHVLCVGVKNSLGTLIVRDPDRRIDGRVA